MRRVGLVGRQRRVLAAVEQANAAGSRWVSGYAVFAAMHQDAGHTNHGRVFSSLRRLTARGLLAVHCEPAAGGTPARAAYRVTPAGAQALAIQTLAAQADARPDRGGPTRVSAFSRALARR